MSKGTIRLLLLSFTLATLPLFAQSLKIDGREIQFHGFASQGFVHTDENNWLTMQTNGVGSGEFTDVGINASLQVTDKFRIGAQGFDRDLGKLGQWHPSLDWAVADYKLASWLGVRAGKVKTTLGLYNDTQDLDFLHIFALLPQSIYPADLRDAAIAHVGADLYGTFGLRNSLGSISYTAYAGHRSDSLRSGYPYFLSQYGIRFSSFGGLQYGIDLRWSTPLHGLLVGISRMNQDTSAKGSGVDLLNPGAGTQPYSENSKSDWTNQYYGRYSVRKLLLESEYRRYVRDQLIYGGTSEDLADVRGWYVSGSYKIFKHLQAGAYYSRYTITNAYGGAAAAFPNQTDTSLPGNHIYDKVITARVDLNRYWDVKLEGHFMNGYASTSYPDGFYPQVNPQGFRPTTNGVVLKTGLNF